MKADSKLDWFSIALLLLAVGATVSALGLAFAESKQINRPIQHFR